jgi:hypothetical protein
MTLNDLKIYLLNTLALGISFTNIENILKILLLLASIIYTAQKTYSNYKNDKEL